MAPLPSVSKPDRSLSRRRRPVGGTALPVDARHGPRGGPRAHAYPHDASADGISSIDGSLCSALTGRRVDRIMSSLSPSTCIRMTSASSSDLWTCARHHTTARSCPYVLQVFFSARASVAPTTTSAQEIDRLIDGLSKVRSFRPIECQQYRESFGKVAMGSLEQLYQQVIPDHACEKHGAGIRVVVDASSHQVNFSMRVATR